MPKVRFEQASQLNWRTANGRSISIGDLSYTHLCAIVEYLKKRMVAQAKLGQAHSAMYTESWLLTMLAEKDRRNVSHDLVYEVVDTAYTQLADLERGALV